MGDRFPVEFWHRCMDREEEGQLPGQALFNTAYEFYPEETVELIASKVDPYYDSTKSNGFLDALAERLNK